MVWNGNFGVEYGRCQNGMEDFNNGTEDNLPHFHTNSILDFVHCIYRIKIQRRIAIGWQAFGRANSVLTRKLPISFKRKVYYQSEVESSRTSLASRTHFQVLGLEASSPWPWPRSLRSSKIALSSARGQHYFLNRWNFVGKRQKPRGKFAKTFLFSTIGA